MQLFGKIYSENGQDHPRQYARERLKSKSFHYLSRGGKR